MFNLCEGDTKLVECESRDEFVAEVGEAVAFAKTRFIGIDPGFDETLEAELVEIGLGGLLD